MTRLAFVPWCAAVRTILDRPTFGVMPDQVNDLGLMWDAGMSPVEAAAAITVAEFERSLNA